MRCRTRNHRWAVLDCQLSNSACGRQRENNPNPKSQKPQLGVQHTSFDASFSHRRNLSPWKACKPAVRAEGISTRDDKHGPPEGKLRINAQNAYGMISF